MPTQRPLLVNNEIYHICFRAVGDAEIFKNKDDYYRGIFSVYEFNTTNLIEIRKRREERKLEKLREARGGLTSADVRDRFVDTLSFCFMPNHIHLLLKQLKDNGISKFMQKLGSGYASYFNTKYSRKGHLFNKFKAIAITTDSQLRHVLTYIHCNPLSLIEPGWKERGIANPGKAMDFLNSYKWSSYQDYVGIKNFPSVSNRDFLLDVVNGSEGCKETVKAWVEYKGEISKSFKHVILE